MKTEDVTSGYKCLFCLKEVSIFQGSQSNIKDGITVRCSNTACTMTGEGHGKDAKAAFEVFNNKCVFGKVK